MMKRILCAMVLLLLPSMSWAQREFVKDSTDPLCLLPSATGAVLTWINHDKEGFKQLVLSTAVATATELALERSIREKRPDGTGHHAFPSTHTMISFNGAAFLQRRYGWRWGTPAYAVSTYVAWGRVYAKRHNTWDVLAGAAVGAGCSYIFTRPFVKDKDISLSPAVIDGHQGVCISMNF